MKWSLQLQVASATRPQKTSMWLQCLARGSHKAAKWRCVLAVRRHVPIWKQCLATGSSPRSFCPWPCAPCLRQEGACRERSPGLAH